MEDLSLHILDIAENSVAAGADLVEVGIIEDTEKDILKITVKDNGHGMNERMLKKAGDPFVTTRTTRKVGLGLPLLAQAAEMCGGGFDIRSEENEGTEVEAVFQHSNIDRQPLGDIKETIIALVVGNPGVDFVFSHRKNGSEFIFDTRDIKTVLEGESVNSSEGIYIIRECLNESNITTL